MVILVLSWTDGVAVLNFLFFSSSFLSGLVGWIGLAWLGLVWCIISGVPPHHLFLCPACPAWLIRCGKKIMIPVVFFSWFGSRGRGEWLFVVVGGLNEDARDVAMIRDCWSV